MKICLNARQSDVYLQKANEIKVEARDHKAIPDLAEKYPNADIILNMGPVDNGRITHENLKTYNILCKENFLVCTGDISPETRHFFESNNIKYYWGYEVCTTYELKALKENTQVCYVRVGAPLFFQQDIVKDYGIPVRVVPNVAHSNYVPHTDGVNGTWIRPEDLHLYEPTVTAIEFEGIDNQEQEQALYRIYAEQHKWPGELNMIVQNLGASPTNRMIPSECTEYRLNCGQRCTSKGNCTLCWRYFSLADPDKLRSYATPKEN